MQGYRRQIAYLYAYEHGRQMRSEGFVKAEERAGRCRLSIHLKGFCRPGEKAGRAYIYFYCKGFKRRPRGGQIGACRRMGEDWIVGICLGELKEQDGALEWQGEFSSGNILDKGVCFSGTGGVWVRRPGGLEYVAEWKDCPVDVGRFVPYPEGGIKCIRCPRFGNCERSGRDEMDGRRTVYEGGDPPGA